MLTYHACSKCDARVRRSRLRNVFEFAISPLIIPWRCSICDRREFKFRFLDMHPKKDDEDEIEIPSRVAVRPAPPAVESTPEPATEQAETEHR
jgi:hypothetical protein